VTRSVWRTHRRPAVPWLQKNSRFNFTAWQTVKMIHRRIRTVRLRKRVFACGLLRREGSRLTFCVRDGAAASGKPGDAGGEYDGEKHYGCCEAESDTLDEIAVGNRKDRLLRIGLRCLIGRPGPISAE
jgi:hypothetical protein